MSKETVEVMVEGGKAVANATIAQPLAPLKVNIQEILKKINEKTSSFSGIKVPVKIIVDTDTKDFKIIVGIPPISELIKNESSAEKGSGEPNKIKIANFAIEQVIKIAKMKQDSMVVNNFKSAVKCVVGSCSAMGVLIEGEIAKNVNKKIDSGLFDKEINAGKTDLDKEKKKALDEQLNEINAKIQKEIERLKAEEEAKKPKVEKVEEVKEEVKEEGKESVKAEVKEGIKEKKLEVKETKEKKEEYKKEKKK